MSISEDEDVKLKEKPKAKSPYDIFRMEDNLTPEIRHTANFCDINVEDLDKKILEEGLDEVVHLVEQLPKRRQSP